MELTPEERRQQLADENLEFEHHGVGHGSKLEAHRVAIVEMRRSLWPYRRIAEWLRENRNVDTVAEGVRSFCRVRGIKKGTCAAQRARKASRKREGNSTTPHLGRPKDPEEKVFTFDSTKPIETWKSKTGVKPKR